VIARLIGETSVGIDDPVGSTIDAVEIAALLRAHGSVGTVAVDGDVTTFRHACGSGGRYWRDNPDVAKVADGEVPGVPGGRPRYCARCVRRSPPTAATRGPSSRLPSRGAVHVAGAVTRTTQHAVQPPSTASTVPVT
jgi:hypothetical protein